ncbi:hypothetical protein PAPHI01_1866 [Pancytospora philotis]|nr:hypothetical protein PAPHI01_1866 [Pancytospora philotis]
MRSCQGAGRILPVLLSLSGVAAAAATAGDGVQSAEQHAGDRFIPLCGIYEHAFAKLVEVKNTLYEQCIKLNARTPLSRRLASETYTQRSRRTYDQKRLYVQAVLFNRENPLKTVADLTANGKHGVVEVLYEYLVDMDTSAFAASLDNDWLMPPRSAKRQIESNLNSQYAQVRAFLSAELSSVTEQGLHEYAVSKAISCMPDDLFYYMLRRAGKSQTNHHELYCKILEYLIKKDNSSNDSQLLASPFVALVRKQRSFPKFFGHRWLTKITLESILSITQERSYNAFSREYFDTNSIKRDVLYMIATSSSEAASPFFVLALVRQCFQEQLFNWDKLAYTLENYYSNEKCGIQRIIDTFAYRDLLHWLLSEFIDWDSEQPGNSAAPDPGIPVFIQSLVDMLPFEQCLELMGKLHVNAEAGLLACIMKRRPGPYAIWQMFIQKSDPEDGSKVCVQGAETVRITGQQLPDVAQL